MKIADYGKAITSYIESPTTAQKLKSKESANLLAEIDFSGMTVPQLRILYERYTGSGAPRDPRELIIELKRLMKNLDQDGIPFATGGRVHLAEGSEDIVEPPKSMQVDTTTKGLDLFTLDKFKDKAEIYVGAWHNKALPNDDIKSALNKFTKKGLEEGTFTIDEAIKVVQDLKFQFQDRAQKQRLRDVIIEGTGTLSREDFENGGRIGFDKGGDFRIALQNLINEGDVNFKSIQDIFDKTNTPRTANLETIFTKEFKNKFNVKKFTITQFANEQGIFKPSTFQKILGATGQKSQPQAYKIIIDALKKAGINLDYKRGGTGSDFENVTKETMDLFNKEVTKLRSEAGLPMTRYQTEKLKKDIRIFVEDKLAKGEYVSRPVIKDHFGIGNQKTDPAAKGFDMLISRSLGKIDPSSKGGTIIPESGLLKELGTEEYTQQAIEKGKKASAAKLLESDDVLKAINDEFKFDPDISDSEELTKKIYGDQFTKANTQGKLDLILQTDNDVFKYLKMLRGNRPIPKGLRLPSQEKIADLIDNIETGLADESSDERGAFKKKGYRFSSGLLRDYKFSIVDEKLGLGSGIFKKERSKFVTKGKNLDEIFGLSSSSKYHPGYAEAVQLLSPSVNKAKEIVIDLPMEKILRALNEGKTTMQYKGKKNVPISKVVEDFNKTSKNFAKKNNIRGPKINLGGAFDLKSYSNFRPESQKNIEETFKNKNYFLSEVTNKPFETITQKTKLLNIKNRPDILTADQIPEPEATKTRKLFEGFGERIKSGASDLKSKMDSSKFLTSKIPGGAAVLGPVDFALAMLGGAPVADAAASAGSYLIKDPYLGKAVNIPIALREIASYNDAEEMLAKAAARQEGLKSMLESIPSRFKETINQAKGVKDETEEFVP
jgi:hypothetical protein